MSESTDAKITLYYAPRTRAFTGLWLLEELELPYRLESFDLASGRHKQADYLALNPMGKVPLVVDDGIAVSEMGAIAIYLCDKYTGAALAPAITDRDRAAYLRWIFFSSAIIEPAFAEKFNKWEARPTSHAWGSFDQMLDTLRHGLASGPYLLGARCTAADVLVGSGMRFGMLFGAIPKEAPFTDYLARLTARPGFVRADAINERENARFPLPPR